MPYSPDYIREPGSREWTLAKMDQIREYVNDPHREVLNGLAEVACFMGWSVSKLRRQIRRYAFPCASATAERGALVISTKTAIRQWIAENHLNAVIKHDWDQVA